MRATWTAVASAGWQQVKISRSRSSGTGPTSGGYVRLKLGATRDGRIVAVEAFLAFEAGAFPGSPIGPAVGTMLGPYDVPNYRIDGYEPPAWPDGSRFRYPVDIRRRS